MNERIHSTISMAIRRRCMTHVLCTCMKNDPISQLRPQQCRAPWYCCSELSGWARPCTRPITAWAAWCATEIWASPSGAKMTRAFWSASRPGARPPHHLRSPRNLMTQTGFVKHTHIIQQGRLPMNDSKYLFISKEPSEHLKWKV